MKNKLTLSCLLKSGYVRVPRIVFVLYFSGDPQEKLLAGLYLYLYTQSYFKTGSVCKHQKVLPCGATSSENTAGESSAQGIGDGNGKGNGEATGEGKFVTELSRCKQLIRFCCFRVDSNYSVYFNN